MFYIMEGLKATFLYVIKTCISMQMKTLGCSISLIDCHKMSITQKWVIGLIYGLCNHYENSISRYVTNHLHLHITNYYIFVCAIPLLLLTVCFTLANANVSSSAACTTIVIFGQISTDPVDPF